MGLELALGSDMTVLIGRASILNFVVGVDRVVSNRVTL